MYEYDLISNIEDYMFDRNISDNISVKEFINISQKDWELSRVGNIPF